MKISESVAPKGRLFLFFERNGKPVKSEIIDNLIVTSGRNAMANLLGGQGGDKNVTKIAMGEGATPASASDTGLTNAATVDITDIRIGTNLEAEDGSTFADARVVQFHFVFSRSVGNGLAVREYGLFCNDDTLFSRIVRDAAFTKTDIDSIRGWWQIQF